VKYDEKSCGIVTFREEEGKRFYLILKYPSGHLDLPKGHVENEETEHETAARELEEETGISQVEFIEGYREPISYIYRRKGKMSNKQVVFFLGKTDQKKIKISFEHHDSYWFEYEEALQKITFDNAKNLVMKAESFLNK